ncbi:MAG: transposase [Bacteroidetes bacterium]|nr:transposase [Bacteroidota bacterium]
MNFIALDVETANADYSSICQIGVAEFFNDQIVNTWETLINPKDYFDLLNISIHGINEEKVKNSPTFVQVVDKLKELTKDKIIIHHMPFDRIAINRACEYNDIDKLEINWLDSAKIVRRTWSEFSYSGYGLFNVANYLKISFKHHNALEDAIAAGKIVLKACELKNMDINDWFERVRKPINIYSKGSSVPNLEGNPEGSLFGENAVFTGSLFITRAEAAKLASDLGCNVSNSVNKKTTMLIVGKQETFKLAGYQKSSKHRKAEKLITEGYEIRILSEDDFKELLKN